MNIEKAKEAKELVPMVLVSYANKNPIA